MFLCVNQDEKMDSQKMYYIRTIYVTRDAFSDLERFQKHKKNLSFKIYIQ